MGNRFGLRVSSAKTEMQQVGRVSQSLNITLGTTTHIQVNDFVYLDGTLFRDATSDKGITRRVGLATDIVRNLGSIWKSPDISKEAKVKLYQTLVQSNLLYNAETWTLKEDHKLKLQVLEMSVLQRILFVTRRDRRRNIYIKKELGIVIDVLMALQQRQLTYFGHVVRMGPERFHNIWSYQRYPTQRTSQEEMNVREDCESLVLSLMEADRLTKDRSNWKHVVSRDASARRPF